MALPTEVELGPAPTWGNSGAVLSLSDAGHGGGFFLCRNESEG